MNIMHLTYYLLMIEEALQGSDIHKCQHLFPETHNHEGIQIVGYDAQNRGLNFH